MTTRQAIVASLLTIALIIGVGIVFVVLFIDLNAPGAEARAGKLGAGVRDDFGIAILLYLVEVGDVHSCTARSRHPEEVGEEISTCR